jgi:aminopeptidase N
MKDPTPQRIYLRDYKAPDFQVSEVDLFFNLNEGITTVTQKTRYKKSGQAENLVLDGEELKLVSVKLNGQAVTDYKKDSVSLTLFKVPAEFELEIVT